MLFPALPWEPCLYYNKAQPRSFLGQTSAAWSPPHCFLPGAQARQGRGEEGSAFQRQQQRSPCLEPRVCLSRERGSPCLGADGLRTAVHPELPPEPPRGRRRRGDSPCVCPSAGSPPGSRGADVIQQLFWQALSESRGEGWTRFPFSLPRLRSAVLPGDSSRMVLRLLGRAFCC